MNEVITSIDGEVDIDLLQHEALQVSQVAIDFAAIQRIPRYCPNRRENNAEHSFMLGLASLAIAPRYYPGLDTGLMTQFSLVHDLPELVTDDIPTFKISTEELQAKHKAEQAALSSLCKTLPPHIADILVYYEEQIAPEARMVRHIDKLLPMAVDVNGAGLQIMREDYGTTTRTQFDETAATLDERYRTMFPEPEHEIAHRAHTLLAQKFAEQF
jgi:5'-deoxynucleotidase YfbR-like HD superfamily hydrolase